MTWPSPTYGQPFWGRREYQRVTTRSPTDQHALLRLYHLTVTVKWVWLGYLGIVVLVAGVAVTRLVTPPPGLVLPEAVARIGTGVVVGLAVGAVVSRRSTPGELRRTSGDFDALLPVTGRARRWFAASAVTAGVCEEVVFRGFFFFYLSTLLPQAGPLAVVALGAAVFGASRVTVSRVIHLRL